MRRLWVLWLLIALLPLRGFAYAAASAADIDPPAATHAVASAPCHSTDADAADVAGADASCALCQICHGVAALPAALQLLASLSVPSVAPPWLPAGGGRLDAEPPFKPPRG